MLSHCPRHRFGAYVGHTSSETAKYIIYIYKYIDIIIFLSFSQYYIYIYLFLSLSFYIYIYIHLYIYIIFLYIYIHYIYIYIYIYRRMARVQTTQQTPSAPSLFIVLASSIIALVFDASLRRSLGKIFCVLVCHRNVI